MDDDDMDDMLELEEDMEPPPGEDGREGMMLVGCWTLAG